MDEDDIIITMAVAGDANEGAHPLLYLIIKQSVELQIQLTLPLMDRCIAK